MQILTNFKFMFSFFILCIVINKILNIVMFFISKKDVSIRQYYRLFSKNDLKVLDSEVVLEHLCSVLEEWGYKNPTISENLEEIICYKNNIATVVYYLQYKEGVIGAESIYSIVGKTRAKKINHCVVVTTGQFDSKCNNEIKSIKKSGMDLKIIDGNELTKLIRENIEKQILTEGVV
ncbi:restriction endonuclease [Clostridium sp. YIM B02505]|uniref:Restriction endonuclease n=1 Tax=Clostridium yunnanense TaxID=2800325 RepID=A0ABS1EW04_9CLOT|nr:restriction endonuclease [Clostridium yunnanense]MBK1813567.1 restriction endonuclease [Clostridium yunnanense]